MRYPVAYDPLSSAAGIGHGNTKESREVVMSKDLSIDEFDALEQISRHNRNTKPSICVARNVKRLSGIKYVSYRKDGQLDLTEQGAMALYAKQCIDGLRAVTVDPLSSLKQEVSDFLHKKGYITTEAEGYRISARGLECLADIDLKNKP